MEKEKGLVGLVLISWYFRIGGAVMILLGVLAPLLLLSMAEYMGSPGQLGWILFIGGGLLLILLGLLYFFVGRGLDKYKSWARITGIVLIVLQVILSIFLMIFLKDFSGNLFRKDIRDSFKE